MNKKELLKKVAETFMFVEVEGKRKNGKVLHLLRRADKQELSMATGKEVRGWRDWDCDGWYEVIPGIDHPTCDFGGRFAEQVWDAVQEYVNM